MSAPVLCPVVFRDTDKGIEVLMRQQGDGPVHFPTFLHDETSGGETAAIAAALQAIAPLITLIRPRPAQWLGLLPIGEPEVWEVVLIPLGADSKVTLTPGEGMSWQSLDGAEDTWAGASRALQEVLQGCVSDLHRLTQGAAA